MQIERLNALANMDLTDFIPSENNVKYKIVIPFLQAFGHTELTLEHAAQGSRIDINIGNKIIVETKALGQDINKHIQQLSDYCGKEFPVLAILTNGRQFRIYSPYWRQVRTFQEKIIYEFDLKNLNNINLLNRLEKIIDYTNYHNSRFYDFIDEREKEIMNVKSQIDDFKRHNELEIMGMRNEIESLKHQMQKLNNQISLKEAHIIELINKRIPDLESLASDYLVPFLVKKPGLDNSKPIVKYNVSAVNNITHITKHHEQRNVYPVTKTSLENGKKSGQRLMIRAPKNGIFAFGSLLKNKRFLVEKGSTLSIKTDPKFSESNSGGYLLREKLIQNGIVNLEREFVTDWEFNSISQAAGVIMGGSRNGNKVWVPVE